MAHQYKCVIFDVDGTILDTSEGILSAVKYTIKKYELKSLNEEIIKSFIGPPIQYSFKKLYGFDDETISRMASTFREKYKDDYLLLAKPYDGIYSVFKYLNNIGIKVAIATYKREDYALKLLNYFNFNKYTNNIFGSDFEGKLRKRDIIELAIKEAEIVNNEQVLVVGDSDNDAIGAKEIGAKFLGVSYGFGFKTKEDVYKFDTIGVANNTKEIIDIISGE